MLSTVALTVVIIVAVTKTKLPKTVSVYFAALARKANAKMVPGSPEAKARTAKARAALKAKRAERVKVT